MAKHYRIHPAIGVARVGNCPTEFYLAPETIGGLPLTCDTDGEQPSDSSKKYVRKFKDNEGRIKRQAARFRLLEYDSDAPDAPGREVKAGQNGIADVQWTVHIANKKPAWWNFSEQAGDLAWGEWNSYEKQAKNPKLVGTPWAVEKRNPDVKGTDARRKLIIDPGPRTVSPGSPRARFDKETDYTHVSFPPPNLVPTEIHTLGELMVDSQGRLLVLGGHGHASGPSFNITSFGGASGWYDDVSDGPVYATVQLEDGKTVEAEMAWVIVGSPKFAPELVNIVTLDDLIYDGAIREMSFNPDIYDPKAFPDGGWNRSYRPNFDRDIKPILDRPAAYRWVSNIPFMNSFAPPPFDAPDASEANRPNREKYLKHFRTPVEPKEYPDEEAATAALNIPNGPAFAFGDGGGGAVAEVPLMPVNSGSNPLNPVLIIKFLTLTPTQYFFLQQWAAGLFDVTAATGPAERSVPAEDRISAGNCVGGPLCPGIETTWIMQNKQIYSSPYRIKPAHPESYYAKHGLDPDQDEGRGRGCEPGDLTKRMAIPWQSDFFDCSTQYVNFTEPHHNKDSTGTPIPPTFFVYWWPPQSPEFTMPNARTPDNQMISGVSVGMQAPYSRGINSFGQMILAWSYLPFIADQNRSDDYQNPGNPRYGYFTEQERFDDKFAVGVVGLGDVSVMGGNYSVNPAGNYVPFWYLLKDVYNYGK